jgi:hypothetical protein
MRRGVRLDAASRIDSYLFGQLQIVATESGELARVSRHYRPGLGSAW